MHERIREGSKVETGNFLSSLSLSGSLADGTQQGSAYERCIQQFYNLPVSIITDPFLLYCFSLRRASLSLSFGVWETERNGAFLFTSTENCCGSGFIRELLQNIVWWYDKIECNKACRRSLSDPGTKYTLINFVFLPAALIIFCSQCNSNSAYRHAGEKAIKSRKKDASTLKTSLSFTQIVIFTSRPGGKITQGERGTLFAECSKAMCLKQNCRKRSENHNTARAVWTKHANNLSDGPLGQQASTKRCRAISVHFDKIK